MSATTTVTGKMNFTPSAPTAGSGTDTALNHPGTPSTTTATPITPSGGVKFVPRRTVTICPGSTVPGAVTVSICGSAGAVASPVGTGVVCGDAPPMSMSGVSSGTTAGELQPTIVASATPLSVRPERAAERETVRDHTRRGEIVMAGSLEASCIERREFLDKSRDHSCGHFRTSLHPPAPEASRTLFYEPRRALPGLRDAPMTNLEAPLRMMQSGRIRGTRPT